MTESHWPTLVKVGVGRGVGDHIAQLHAGGFQGRLILAQQGVALNHLSASRVTGDDDLLHIRKLLAIAQAGDDFVQRIVGTHTKGCCGFTAGHPLIALPAQDGVCHLVLCNVGFIEELRGNHQRRSALPSQFDGVLAALQIGLCIAQATMDDDQYPFDFGRGPTDAHRDFSGFQQQAPGTEFLDPMLGGLGRCACEQYD